MRTALVVLSVLVVVAADGAILNRPYLQAVGQNSIYVLVECTSADTVAVEYGLSQSYGETATTELISATTASPTTYVHKIRLPNLMADTVYHYIARQSGAVSADSWFRTAKPPGRGFRFAWMADSRTNSGVYDAVAARVLDKEPEFLLLGGDVCATSAYSSWQAEFFRPTGLALLARVPFFFAAGNHEGWATNSMAFTHAPASASGSQDYFSFDYGDLHVLVLDTQVSYSPGSPQYLFAQSDLAATTRPWKIVACHKPAYCSGGHGEDAGMKTMTTNIFEPAGVDLVIAGHSHFYQHNRVHGLNHLVVGTAGAPQYTPTNASYTLRSVQDYNYAVFDVTPATLRITVRNSADALLDTLQFSKPPTDVSPEEGELFDFHLDQNYPNPFNAISNFGFRIAKWGMVELTVFDLLGRQVVTLVHEPKEPGAYTVRWDASGISSGMYFYRLTAGEFTQTKRLVLLK